MFEKLELTDSKRQDVNGDFLLPIPNGCKITTEKVPFAPGTRLAIIPEANSFSDEVKDMPFVFCIADDGATLQNDERFDPAHLSRYALQILLELSKDIDGDKQYAFRDGFGIIYNVQDGTAKQSVLKLHGMIFAENTIYQFIMFRIGISSAEKDIFISSVLDWFGSFRLHGEDLSASLAEVVRRGNPYTWKSDYIAIRNDNTKVYAVGKEWELTLPAGVSASVNSKYNATLNGQDETALLVLKGLKQNDGSLLFHFGLQRAMENVTLNDCKYDSRFLENANEHEDGRYLGLRVTTAHRAIVNNSDDLFIDMINEDMFPFFSCIRILIRVRGKNIDPYDFQMCAKKEKLNQAIFDKISAKMKELAYSITLIRKSAQTSQAKKSVSSKKSGSNKIINNPKCIMNGTVLDKYIGTEEDIVLPEGITELADGIFSGRTKIRTVVVPETVRKIGYRAFENCYSLQKIALPTNLQSIEDYAFVDCHKLESINLESQVARIGGSAFSECYEMPDVVIGNKVQEIDAFAFKNCRKIKHFIIPDGVETIGFSAFTNCKELERLYIPASLKTIKENPINQFLFAGCDKLTIHTPAGSFAEKYAKDHNIPVVTEEKPSFRVKGLSRVEVLAGIASLPNTAAGVSLTEDQQEDEEASSAQAEKWMQENGVYVEKNPTVFFEGKVFVFSGIAMHTVEQEDPIVQAVIKKGGQYRSKVSGLTNYLVVDPRYCGSSKTAAAIEQQRKGKPVKIILLEDLKAILKGKTKSTKKATSVTNSAFEGTKTASASSSKKTMPGSKSTLAQGGETKKSDNKEASAWNKSDAGNDFPRAEVEDSRKRLLIRKPKKTDSPNRFALALIPIDITGYRSFYFNKRWPAYPQKLEELMRAADTMVKLFRDDSLTSDRESELRHGYIRDAYTFHALRSFVWTSVEYCKDNRIKLEDFDLEKSLALAQFIHDRGGANYKITDKNAKRIGAGILTKTEKDYRLTDESYILLVDSLHALIPIMERAYHHLNDLRQQGEWDDTESTLGDVVAGWCAFAFACASEFEIKSGPEDSIPAKCRELPTIKNDLKVLEGHFYLKGTNCIACTKEDETVEFPEGIELISIPRNFDDISGSKEFYHGMTKIIFPSSYTCREGWLSFPPCAKEIEFQGDFGDINTPFMGSEEYCVEKVIFHGKGDRLASFAFYGAKHLKEIVLPETLREIGKCSFMQTPQLNEIRIPPDVEEIGEDAFGKSGNQSKKVLVVDKGSKAEGVVRRFVAGREDLTYKAVISPKEQKRIDEENRMRRIAAALQRKLAGAYRDSLDQGSYQSLKKELYDIVSGECDMNTWHELQALGVPYLPETLAKSTREQIATMPAQGSDYNDLPSILAKDYIQRADDKRMRLAEITETRNRNIAKLNAEAAALKDELSHLGFFQGKRKKEIASRLTSIEEQIRRENNLYEEMRKSL